MWVRRTAAGQEQERLTRVTFTSASAGGAASVSRTEMVSWVRTMGEKLKQRLRLDVGREICRQYPLFCFLLLCLSAASLILNRYHLQCGTPWAASQAKGAGWAAAGRGRERLWWSRLGSRKAGCGGLRWLSHSLVLTCFSRFFTCGPPRWWFFYPEAFESA